MIPKRPFGTDLMFTLEAGAEPAPGYRLRTRLGAGAFAEVWDASTPDGGCVALKFLDGREQADRVRGEIRALQTVRSVRHPNLIRLLGVYGRGRYVVLAMERADGNLEQLRQAYQDEAGTHIPPEHLLDLLDQAAAGLDCLAALRPPGLKLTAGGMQHCDVKPSNLLLLGDTVKVADFGLCAVLGERTHRGGLRGTPPYAAPELFRGLPSRTSDQYALAVTWCDLLAGRRMVRQASPDGSGGGIDLGRARSREVPVLTRALSPDPTARWPSCRAFVAALRAAATGSRPGRPRAGLEARSAAAGS
jgi:serine/threonine-protein kinase